MLGIEIKTYTLQNAECDHLLLALLFLCLVFLWRFFCFLFLLSLYRLFVFTIGIRFFLIQRTLFLDLYLLALSLTFPLPSRSRLLLCFWLHCPSRTTVELYICTEKNDRYRYAIISQRFLACVGSRPG